MYEQGKMTWLSACSAGRLHGEQNEDGIVGEHGRRNSEDGKPLILKAGMSWLKLISMAIER